MHFFLEEEGNRAAEPEPRPKTSSSRARLHFPRGRVHRLLPKGNYSERVGDGVPVYETTVVEYKAEIPELAGNGAHHKTYTTHPTPEA